MIEDSDFPENPFMPSLKYAAAQQLPVTIPWSGPAVALGTGFDTSTELPVRKEFSAFSPESGDGYYALYREAQGGSYVEATTLSSGHSYDHMNLSIAAEAGGSFLGASGKGTYETKALACQDATKASIRSTMLLGRVYHAKESHLSLQARNILKTSISPKEDPTSRFRQLYGNYYVTSIIIGASAATMVSASESGSSSSKDSAVDLTGKILGFTKTKRFEDHTAKQAFDGKISLNGYDSLTNGSIIESGVGAMAYPALKEKANANLEASRRVGGRIEQVMARLGCINGATVSQETYDALFNQHLVASLVLTPFANHRDYVEICLSRN